MAALRFKLDEDLPRDAAELLRRAGHDVRTVHDEDLGGALDSVVMEVCRRKERILLTLDLDFADIRAYPPAETPGVVVLRPRTQSILAVLGLLERVLGAVATDGVTHRLWVVEPGRIRVRE